jgi:hypothetical protein
MADYYTIFGDWGGKEAQFILALRLPYHYKLYEFHLEGNTLK